MPYKDAKKRRDYMRNYMRDWRASQTEILRQLKTQYPDIDKLIRKELQPLKPKKGRKRR